MFLTGEYCRPSMSATTSGWLRTCSAVVECRYSDFKGPLTVAPVFLHHIRRIAALITVICLALLVFCLIERQVRQALGGNQTMRGLYPDNRALRPTGRMIFYHLADLRIRAGTATDPPTILITRSVQAHLPELLGIDETRPRWLETWLETSKPMCEIRV